MLEIGRDEQAGPDTTILGYTAYLPYSIIASSSSSVSGRSAAVPSPSGAPPPGPSVRRPPGSYADLNASYFRIGLPIKSSMAKLNRDSYMLGEKNASKLLYV